MKKLLFVLLMLLAVTSVKAQTYGNEWINYSQQYYRFEITQSGIYKLDYLTLANSGIPVGSFSSANIQLFGRQQEIPLFMADGGDNSFDPGDYFLFYAERNDGWMDSLLYSDPSKIGNPYYSLYNDTINYFFTWNNLTTNKRFVVENDQNYGAYQAAPYWIYEAMQNWRDMYNEGEVRHNTLGYSVSTFEGGEGWTSGNIQGNNGAVIPLNAPTVSLYNQAGAPAAQFTGVSVSNSNASTVPSGQPNHHVQWKLGTSNTIIYDEAFNGYKQVKVNTTVPVSLLSDGNTPLSWNIIGDLGVASDIQNISYWRLRYPKQTTLNGQARDEFHIVNSTAAKIRLDILGASFSNPTMFVFGQQAKFIPLSNNNGVWQALVSNNTAGNEQKVVVADASQITSITTLIPVTASGYFKNYAQINAEKALIMVYNKKIASAAAEYAAYRSGIGGFHNVVFADVEELYWQYGGGIEKHAIAIRRFSHHLYNLATNEKPFALFLIGKGIREANEPNSMAGQGARKNASNFSRNLIPSYGYPSSDLLFTCYLENSGKNPLIPVGRISVETNEELTNYLNKVKVFEEKQNQNDIYTSANKDWQKQVLHFSGGSNIAQQTAFQTYLTFMEEVVEADSFAGHVTTYRKSSSAPLDPTTISGLKEKLENGVSLINIFSHATATGFEINIDEPVNWNNTGKYPVILANGCYAGDIYQPFESASERFVKIPNLGAIAFISPVRTGIDVPLYGYSMEFYRQFSKQNYRNYLSHQIKSTMENLTNETILDLLTQHQMAFHGDPLLKLNWHTKPEIEISPESISFSPTNIDLTTDSIEIRLAIKNLGISITSEVNIEIKRDFPMSSVDSVYSLSIPYLHYADTVRLKMPLQPNIGVGLNNFTVSVDIPSMYGEQFDEIYNNQITKQLFINVDGIVPVYPYKFAVVPKDSVTVKGSTINPIADFRSYRFEIDTTDLFNSPEKRYAVVSGLGGVKEVKPTDWKKPSNNTSFPLVCTDSTVYFWRCALDSSVLVWRESSFQYIRGKEGWGQDHFFQFKDNHFSSINYNRPDRTRDFDTISRILKATVYDNATTNATTFETRYFIDGFEQEYGFCSLNPSLHVAVIDPVTLAPWLTRFPTTPASMSHFFGNANDNGSCRQRSEKYFIFRQDNAQQLTNFQNMIQAIPDGHYVLIYTARFANYDAWNQLESQLPQSMYDVFAQLGSDSIVPGRENRAFVFFAKKGDLSTVVENVAQVNGQFLSLNGELRAPKIVGGEVSPMIGPSNEWKTLYWKQDPAEEPTSDSTRLKIQLFDANGFFQQDLDLVFSRNDSILQLNNLIPAQQYPFMKLEAYYNDTLDFTPAQVDRWHVLYTPVPEAAIDGSSMFTWLPTLDSLDEGQTLQFAVDVKNISEYNMDSLLVKYWIEDANQVKHYISYPRQEPLLVNGVIRDTIEFNTSGFGGVNSFWMEVNPYLPGSAYQKDQPEQYHFNNLLQIPFYVRGDDLNPILDVTFDGRHILNGDIVSPFSEISISLKDDNPYLIMNDVSDTTLFGVYLTSPDGVQRRIPFVDGNGNTVMQWIPAEAQHKRFRIIYPAALEQDGKYTLLVQGSDRSGNLSGDLEYKITFEVIHEASISYLMNYPNPFSTSTRFVFTVTGSEVPDEMIIQIMTVTGKVVREITEDELGPIHIGRNVSEYAWDGTDEFGDPLANGVYLYRVKSQLNGEAIKHRETGADPYFKKEFGKMYLMR